MCSFLLLLLLLFITRQTSKQTQTLEMELSSPFNNVPTDKAQVKGRAKSVYSTLTIAMLINSTQSPLLKIVCQLMNDESILVTDFWTNTYISMSINFIFIVYGWVYIGTYNSLPIYSVCTRILSTVEVISTHNLSLISAFHICLTLVQAYSAPRVCINKSTLIHFKIFCLFTNVIKDVVCLLRFALLHTYFIVTLQRARPVSNTHLHFKDLRCITVTILNCLIFPIPIPILPMKCLQIFLSLDLTAAVIVHKP